MTKKAKDNEPIHPKKVRCPECNAKRGEHNISYCGAKPGDIDHMNAHICTNKWHG